MKTNDVAPRIATIDRTGIRREGRPATYRLGAATAAAGAALSIAIAACSPGASTLPIPSGAVPSVNVSAGASAASAAAIAALDQVDTAIAANQTSGSLTADDASDLKELTTGIRTSLQTGDMAAARTALDSLSTEVDGLAAKLNSDAGRQLTAAITALKAALPSS